MFVYSSVFTSFQSADGSTASVSDFEDSSNAMDVANAAPAALKKPLRDRFMSSSPSFSSYGNVQRIARQGGEPEGMGGRPAPLRDPGGDTGEMPSSPGTPIVP